MKNTFARSLAFLFLLLNKLYAQEQWTYTMLFKHMSSENPELKYNKLEFELANNHLRASKYERLPSLNGNVYNSFSNGRSLDQISYQYTQQNVVNNIYRVNAAFDVFQGGKTNIRIHQGELGVDIAKYELESATSQLYKSLFEKYIEINVLDELIKLRNQKKLLLKKLRDVSSQLASAGKSTNTATSYLDIEINKIEQDEVDLNYRKDYEILKIKALIGKSVDNFAIAPLGKFDVDTSGYSLSQIQDIAKGSINLKLAQKRTSYSQKGIGLARSSLFPTITLGGGLGSGYSSLLVNRSLLDNAWDGQMRNNYYQQVFINVYVPIFNKLQYRVAIQNAKVGLEQSKVMEQKEYLSLLEYLLNQNSLLKSSCKRYLLGVNSDKLYDQIVDEMSSNFKANRVDITKYILVLQQSLSMEDEIIFSKYNNLKARKYIELVASGTLSVE